MLRVRQIYYKEIQKVINMERTRNFVPYYNPISDETLESGVIRRLFEEGDYKDSEYYGVLSHKFYKKLKKDSNYIENTILNDEDKADVYSFFGNLNKTNLITQGNNWHPLFVDIYKVIANRLDWGIDLEDNKALMQPIYSNHWIASKETFKEFCLDFLIPVTNLMNESKLLRDLCNQDANYISREKINPETCLKVFNRPYYTYHCFILERLFPIFCYLRGKTVKHI